MKNIKEIIKELNLNWNEPIYLVINGISSKAVITNLNGIIFIAKKKTINIEHESDDHDVVVHDLKNELESIGIYVEPVLFGYEPEYEDVEIVNTINEFLGE